MKINSLISELVNRIFGEQQLLSSCIEEGLPWPTAVFLSLL